MEVSLPYSQFLLKEMPAILDYALYTKSNVLAFRYCAGLKTFFFPCGTFSRIASVATNRQISKWLVFPLLFHFLCLVFSPLRTLCARNICDLASQVIFTCSSWRILQRNHGLFLDIIMLLLYLLHQKEAAEETEYHCKSHRLCLLFLIIYA